jgi:hypothetical protein
MVRFNDVPSWDVWKKQSSSTFQIRSHKPRLVRIDNLIKQYKRNDRADLVALSEALVDWAADKIDRAADTGRLEAMRALEEVVQRKLREFERASPQKYWEVVCIGYVIRTGGRGYWGPANPSMSLDAQMEFDVRGRTRQMVDAIRLARQNYLLPIPERTDAIRFLGNRRGSLQEQDAKRLKIFMAPEFYFRGAQGAYSIEKGAKVLPRLREETKDTEYADWLFVLGSVICTTQQLERGKKDGTGKFVPVNTLKEESMSLENYALVQKGGYAQSDWVHDYFLAKEYVSGIDYDYTNAGKVKLHGGDHNWSAIEGGRPGDPDPLAPQKERAKGGCIFTMDGITFGLEVCLDHRMKRLVSASDKDGVQIQLIPSAGMSIMPDRCVNDAIVFNVDGGAPAAPPHIDLVVNDGSGGHVAEFRKVRAPAAQNYFPEDGYIHFYRPLAIP